MSAYGFKKPAPSKEDQGADKLDLTGLDRVRVDVDPQREADAVARGAAMGFVDRAERDERAAEERPVRRRRETVKQGNLFIKGPQSTLDWFVDFTNQGGHRSYWEALEQLRAIATKADGAS